jgi:hypothetical protein
MQTNINQNNQFIDSKRLLINNQRTQVVLVNSWKILTHSLFILLNLLSGPLVHVRFPVPFFSNGLLISLTESPSSVLPVMRFSFILNFKQLSSLRRAGFFRSLFFVVIKGESHYMLVRFLSSAINGLRSGICTCRLSLFLMAS